MSRGIGCMYLGQGEEVSEPWPHGVWLVPEVRDHVHAQVAGVRQGLAQGLEREEGARAGEADCETDVGAGAEESENVVGMAAALV